LNPNSLVIQPITFALPAPFCKVGAEFLNVIWEEVWRVFENRVLRRIFGPRRDEVGGGWRKLHNEELRALYSSPSVIRMIKSRRMIWAGHIAQMGRRGMCIGYW
jgi:hypothetical protein